MIDFSSLNKLREELGTAISVNDIERIESLVRRPNSKSEASGSSQYLANLNYLDKDGQTPLHLACLVGSVAICRLLMEAGASQAIKNRDGWFPIHLASYLGHVDIVVHLLDDGKSAKDTLVNVYDDHANSSTHLSRPYDFKLSTALYPLRVGKLYRTSDTLLEDDEYSSSSSDSSSESTTSDEDESGDEEERLSGSGHTTDCLSSSQTTTFDFESEFLSEQIFDLKNLDLSAKDFLF